VHVIRIESNKYQMRGVTLYTLLSVLLVSSFLVIPASAKKSNNMAEQKKTNWAELVGKTGEEAKAAILKDRPGLEVHIFPEDSMMTTDYREDRVRILVDTADKVAQAPHVG